MDLKFEVSAPTLHRFPHRGLYEGIVAIVPMIPVDIIVSELA